MLLYESPILKLDYTPSQDILIGALPDIHEFSMAEVKGALSTIATTIRQYDVKRYLMDARKSIIDVDDQQYNALVLEFAKELQTSRLKRFARLQSPSTARESAVKTVVAQFSPKYQIKTFTEKEEAIKWLLESE